MIFELDIFSARNPGLLTNGASLLKIIHLSYYEQKSLEIPFTVLRSKPNHHFLLFIYLLFLYSLSVHDKFELISNHAVATSTGYAIDGLCLGLPVM